MPDPPSQSSERIYAAIDLKSFYASVECAERGWDALSTHLVVADASRTEKTICLAVSPALKAHGIPGRPRLFEVVQKARAVNRRRSREWGHPLQGEAFDSATLAAHPEMALGYHVVPPRMALYLDYSTRVYAVYLKYIAPEDMHVYSIDEVFIDLTPYLSVYHTTAHELTARILRDVVRTTGITATAGMGPNLYLAKVAMDIMAKHTEPDADGVRIAQLTEASYRHRLWAHRPLTDFWRIGHGYAEKLAAHGMYTMGDIARRSLSYEDSLYSLFGVNAELLIDHAWGWEPCTMADIKAYRPASSSLSSGQVLEQPYDAQKGKLIAREMADQLALDLVDKGMVCEQITLHVGYDIDNMTRPDIHYTGPLKTDRYGRQLPKSAHGSRHLPCPTSSSRLITEAVSAIYDTEVDPHLLIRRITLGAQQVIPEGSVIPRAQQLSLFDDPAETHRATQLKASLAREHKMQQTMLEIKKKFGKNAILRGMNLEDGAMTAKRNKRIGGHSA